MVLGDNADIHNIFLVKVTFDKREAERRKD
jgi:hypothetical protein